MSDEEKDEDETLGDLAALEREEIRLYTTRARIRTSIQRQELELIKINLDHSRVRNSIHHVRAHMLERRKVSQLKARVANLTVQLELAKNRK